MSAPDKCPVFDHEFNPWKNGKRTHERNWNAVRRWNDHAFDEQEEGTLFGKDIRRPRVLCSCDWLDPEAPVQWLADMLALIHETPNLDWLLLTKRPEKWASRMRAVLDHFGPGMNSFEMVAPWLLDSREPSNIWIGTTVEDQQRADERIPELLKIPARVRFLSCEPLLGPVRLDSVCPMRARLSPPTIDALAGETYWSPEDCELDGPKIHWVICGGDSGPNARPMHPDWARSMRDQCEGAGVPFFFKQWGEWLDAGDAVRRAELGTPRRENERILNLDGGHGFHGKSAIVVARVGKHRAGRMLDGQDHSAFPEVRP